MIDTNPPPCLLVAKCIRLRGRMNRPTLQEAALRLRVRHLYF
jgi:hypothetical protein